VKINDCKECEFYDVDSEVMVATCHQLPQWPMSVDTAPPYNRPIRPPKECPINNGLVQRCPHCNQWYREG
jgi:hypothetical protein